MTPLIWKDHELDVSNRVCEAPKRLQRVSQLFTVLINIDYERKQST